MAKVLYLSSPLYPHCNFPILGALHFLLPTLGRPFLFSLPLRLTHGNVISQQQPAPSFKNANWIMSVSCSKTFSGSSNCPRCPTTSCLSSPGLFSLHYPLPLFFSSHSDLPSVSQTRQVHPWLVAFVTSAFPLFPHLPWLALFV